MVRQVDSTTSNHLQAREGVIPRNFVWITAKDRETGTLESIGFWDGLDSVDVTVVSGTTGALEERTYHAWGALLQIDRIQRAPELSIRTIRIGLSQVSEAVQQVFRGYDARLAPVEVHRGFLNPETRLLLAPPVPRFIGWINKAPLTTPKAGEEGGVSVEVVSHVRMLTRTNPGRRSDNTQRQRGGDRFRRYAGTAAEWEFWWGEKSGTVSEVTQRRVREVWRGA